MTIISLTTIPSRLPVMQECIKSLEQQDFPVHVYLPEYCHRKKQNITQKDIPNFLKNCSVHLVQDEGSITKIRPALRSGEFDRIITADDDIYYPAGWADNLVQYSEKYPHSVIAYRGRVMYGMRKYRRNKVKENVNQEQYVNFITGVSGVLYRPEFFTQQFIDSNKFTTVDDIDISVEVNKNKIPIMVVPGSKGIKALNHHKTDRLYKRNVRGTNDKELKRQGFWDVVQPV